MESYSMWMGSKSPQIHSQFFKLAAMSIGPYIAGIVVLTVLCLSAVSCKKDPAKEIDKQLTQAIAGLSFPQKLNDNTTLTDCYYVDKVLTFRCEIDKKALADMDVDKKREDTLDKLKTGLFPRNLIRNVANAGASIRYIYVNGGDSVMFSYAPEDLNIAE